MTTHDMVNQLDQSISGDLATGDLATRDLAPAPDMTPITTGSSPLGGACGGDGDCAPGLTCYTKIENVVTYPGGYCSYDCSGSGAQFCVLFEGTCRSYPGGAMCIAKCSDECPKARNTSTSGEALYGCCRAVSPTGPSDDSFEGCLPRSVASSELECE